jgi:tRNA(Ile)-lysidine synthase
MANIRNSLKLSKSTLASVVAFERALEEILTRVVVSAERNIAVAYSGGLDSSVLLHLAKDFCMSRQIKLYAFHIHHGISPNADTWLAHCEAQAKQQGVHFFSQRVNLIDVAEHGIEQSARIARYAALNTLCKQHQIPLLITAHHQDDQAESVLLQLLRGSGLPGLSGMAELQLQHSLLENDIALGRPMLQLTRQQLEDLATTLDITHIDDESNADTRYKRNAVRAWITPVLEKNFPSFATQFTRSAKHIQSAQRLLDELAQSDLEQCAEGSIIFLDKLQSLSVDRVDNLLRYWIRDLAIYAPSNAQLEQLRQQMLRSSHEAHPLIEIAGLHFQRRGQQLYATKEHSKQLPPTEIISFVWQGESEIDIPAWYGKIQFKATKQGGFDAAALRKGPLSVRPRSGSEKLKPDSARPTRSLKNLFQEAEISAQDRIWLPLLYLGEDLIFVPRLGGDKTRCIADREGILVSWEKYVS